MPHCPTPPPSPPPPATAAPPPPADLKPRHPPAPRRPPATPDATRPARLPACANSVACRLPAPLGPVILTIGRPDEEALARAVDAGDPTPDLPIHLRPPATNTHG